MHKFTEVASGEREKQILSFTTLSQDDNYFKTNEIMKSNLPAKEK